MTSLIYDDVTLLMYDDVTSYPGKALLLMSRYVLLISYKEKEYITAVFDQFIDVSFPHLHHSSSFCLLACREFLNHKPIYGHISLFTRW